MNNTNFPTMGAILEADDYGVVVTALKTALELDIFEIVARGQQSVEEIAGAANCNTRAMGILLDVLCVKNLLDKSNGCYSLTPTSETYLVRSGRGYCVPLYLAWLQAREKFIDFVRTGEAALDLTSPAAEELWVSYAAPDRVRLPELVEIVHKRWTDAGILSRVGVGTHILDLGCGSGFKSFTLLQMIPDARVTAVDSSNVLEITREIADLMGVTERVTFQNGDVDRELPEETFDMVLIGNLLHYYDSASVVNILQKMHRVIKANGIIVLYAKAVDEKRKSDPALLSTIDISNCAPHGQAYTFTEYRDMLQAAGFRNVNYCEPVIISAEK
jgi:ubiquinone/menaquinone biosynthesis C-methylase UbiE